MNRTVFTAAVCAALAQTGFVAAQTAAPSAQTITRAATQAATAGPAEFFAGRVRVEPVWPANEHINASGGMVTFEPGARSAWHTHPSGQRLLVISGVGLTQEWGKAVQEIRAGDVAVVSAGREALARRQPDHGDDRTWPSPAPRRMARTSNWMEKVTDEQYNAR